MENQSKKKSSFAWLVYAIVGIVIVLLTCLGPNVAAWILGAASLLTVGFLFIAYKNKEELTVSQESSLDYWKGMYQRVVSEKSALERDYANLESSYNVAKAQVKALEDKIDEIQNEPVEIPSYEVPEVVTPETEEVVFEDNVVVVEEEEAPAKVKKNSKRSKK